MKKFIYILSLIGLLSLSLFANDTQEIINKNQIELNNNNNSITNNIENKNAPIVNETLNETQINDKKEEPFNYYTLLIYFLVIWILTYFTKYIKQSFMNKKYLDNIVDMKMEQNEIIKYRIESIDLTSALYFTNKKIIYIYKNRELRPLILRIKEIYNFKYSCDTNQLKINDYIIEDQSLKSYINIFDKIKQELGV